jgi:predicted enzyme related to lactoylglutathione lyase
MDITRYRHGELCWADLGTTDLDAARRFYGELFGWQLAEEVVNGDLVYVRARLGGKDICAMYEMPADERAAAPPHWNVYVAVDDVHTTAARVDTLGGLVFAGPFDVMDLGRMAMVQDPGGAMVNLWQARGKLGAERIDEPRALTWFQLAAREPAAVRAFYAGLFGWRADDAGWQLGERHLAGLSVVDGPGRWWPCFQVTSCERAVDSVERLGGRALSRVRELDGLGQLVSVSDPAGATFSLLARPA